MKITMAGEVLIDSNRYDLYKTYEDLYKENRGALIACGIAPELVRKFRTPKKTDATGDGVDAAKAVSSAYGKKYLVPLDFELIAKHGAFYSRGASPIIFEVTLAEANNLIGSLIGGLTTALSTAQTYSITNLELQYESIHSNVLAVVVKEHLSMSMWFCSRLSPSTTKTQQKLIKLSTFLEGVWWGCLCYLSNPLNQEPSAS